MDLKHIAPEKVLIISPFGIGDVLFTTPLIANLKAQFPNVMIGYVGNKRTAPMLKDHAKIDQVYTYESDEFVAISKQSKWAYWKKLRDFSKPIKEQGYDVVFDFSVNRVLSFLTWRMGIKHRIGFDYKNRSLFLTHKMALQGFEGQHAAECFLDILRDLKVDITCQDLELTIKEEDHAWADDFLKKHGFEGQKPLMGIFPGGGASWGNEAVLKQWEPLKYAKLVDKIIEKFPTEFILFGDSSEKGICQTVLENTQAKLIPAFGQTTLGQLCALFARCQGVVLNDGGPLHLAVASKTKTVSIFGPVDPNVYGPYGTSKDHYVVTKDIECRPCYHNFRMADCDHISCLRKLEVEEVMDKVSLIL